MVSVTETRRTELVDPRYAKIDSLAPLQSLALQLGAQGEALAAVEAALESIRCATDAATRALRHSQGRLIAVGAGTSGRLGIQDLVELTPTFNWPPERIAYLMAGGLKAVFRSVEGAEDNAKRGAARMKRLKPTANDVVIGVAASGTTPFTNAAIKKARDAGAVTIGVANNLAGPLLAIAEYPVGIDSGSEVISGSTRLKAGTTQKVVLNMISNQIMINLGKVYDGLMVDMRATNEKLRDRAVRMVENAAECDNATARQALLQTENRVKPAILVAAFGLSAAAAESVIETNDGNLHAVVHELRSPASLALTA